MGSEETEKTVYNDLLIRCVNWASTDFKMIWSALLNNVGVGKFS